MDDLLLVCTDTYREIDALKKRCGEVKSAEGLIHNYRGLVVDFTDAPIITLNQTGMIEYITACTRAAASAAGFQKSKLHPRSGLRITPKIHASAYLFNIRE